MVCFISQSLMQGDNLGGNVQPQSAPCFQFRMGRGSKNCDIDGKGTHSYPNLAQLYGGCSAALSFRRLPK
jgi:hypothetical protein